LLTIDFSFRELEIFCKVVELGSFSKAAEAIFLVQASVSERIASLEKKIGTRLLDRLGRKAIPPLPENFCTNMPRFFWK